MAGFFPVFFKQYWSYGADVNLSTARLGFGNSIASLFIALIAPLIGAIADRGSIKKKFLVFFAYLGIVMTASLILFKKETGFLPSFFIQSQSSVFQEQTFFTIPSSRTWRTGMKRIMYPALDMVLGILRGKVPSVFVECSDDSDAGKIRFCRFLVCSDKIFFLFPFQYR